MDLERQGNILIIGHQAILRCIYAYFMNYNQEDLPYIKIPLHTVIELSPRAYVCDERRYKGKYYTSLSLSLNTCSNLFL